MNDWQSTWAGRAWRECVRRWLYPGGIEPQASCRGREAGLCATCHCAEEMEQLKAALEAMRTSPKVRT